MSMLPPGPYYEDPSPHPLSSRKRHGNGPSHQQARASASYHQYSNSRPQSRQSQHSYRGGNDSMPNSARSYSHDSLYSGGSGAYIPPGTHATPRLTDHNNDKQNQQFHQQKNYQTYKPPGHFSRSRFDFKDEVESIPGIEKLRQQGMFDPSVFDYPAPADIIRSRGSRDAGNTKFIQNTACFPELPQDAHLLLYRMGIDIFDCTDVDFHQTMVKGYHGYNSNVANGSSTQRQCLAVMAKKVNSGQVWLIVFKILGEGLKSNVVYNRLLTLSCGLWMRSTLVVELSAPSSENVLFMLNSADEADRFFRLLHQACNVRWKRPEVIKEDQMKTLFQKATRGQNTDHHWGPAPRGPFTLATSSKDHNYEEGNGEWKVLASDLDDNWRSNTFPRKNPGAGGDAFSTKTRPPPATPEEPDLGEVILTLDGVEIQTDTTGGQYFSNSGGRAGYKSLGKGQIELISYEKGARELVFTNKNGQQGRDFTHFIFKWATPKMRDCRADCRVVMWRGAAAFGKRKNEKTEVVGYCVGGFDLRNVAGVFEVPANKKFLAHFDTKEDAEKFFTAMKTAVEKVSKKEGIAKHISWYIDNRCGPLTIPPKYPLNVHENPYPIYPNQA